jgi:hypothetical protein
MLHTTFIISYFDPVQITITISYVFSILYHINVYRILLLMPASSVAIALAFRKNRSLGKTFWFTVNIGNNFMGASRTIVHTLYP